MTFLVVVDCSVLVSEGETSMDFRLYMETFYGQPSMDGNPWGLVRGLRIVKKVASG